MSKLRQSIFLVHLNLFLISCATTSPSSNSTRSNTDEIVQKLQKLDQRLDYVEYENTNVICFLNKDVCYLQASVTCYPSSGQQCVKNLQKQCFQVHEKCIIDNYHRWKRIKSSKGN